MSDQTAAPSVSPASTEPTNFKPEDRPRRSPTIAKIALALSKAQGEIENADKDGTGTYGKYATLAATWVAIRAALSKNEIAVYQRPLTIKDKQFMATMLVHSSGEFFDDGELEMKVETNNRMNAMQALGSAVTYARRYTLQAATGVAPADDDDGAGAGDPKGKDKPQKENPPARPAPPKDPPPKADPKKQEPPADPRGKIATDAEIKTLIAMATQYGYTEIEFRTLLTKTIGRNNWDKPKLTAVELIQVNTALTNPPKDPPPATSPIAPEDESQDPGPSQFPPPGDKIPEDNLERPPATAKASRKDLGALWDHGLKKGLKDKDLVDILLARVRKQDWFSLTNMEATAVRNAIDTWNDKAGR